MLTRTKFQVAGVFGGCASVGLDDPIGLWFGETGKSTPGSFLSDYLIFECKNWAAPVDSATVASFIAKVRAARLELGVLVAANGITGDAQQRTAANDIIRQAFVRDNIKILVVTRAEIEGFRSVADVIALMREKFGALIMGFAEM